MLNRIHRKKAVAPSENVRSFVLVVRLMYAQTHMRKNSFRLNSFVLLRSFRSGGIVYRKQ